MKTLAVFWTRCRHSLTPSNRLSRLQQYCFYRCRISSLLTVTYCFVSWTKLAVLVSIKGELPLRSFTDLDGYVTLIQIWYVLIPWEVRRSMIKRGEFPTSPCSKHQFVRRNIFFVAVIRSLIAPFCVSITIRLDT